MISRLMLNIRDPRLSSSYRDERTTTETPRTQPVFTSFIDTSLGREDDEWELSITYPRRGPSRFFFFTLFLHLHLHRYPVGESDKICSLLNEGPTPLSTFTTLRMHMVSLSLFRSQIFTVAITLDCNNLDVCTLYYPFECLPYLYLLKYVLVSLLFLSLLKQSQS